jgi:hypothetical protein
MLKNTVLFLFVFLVFTECTTSEKRTSNDKQVFFGLSLDDENNAYLGIAGDFRLVKYSNQTDLMLMCYYATVEYPSKRKISQLKVQIRMKYTPDFDIRDAKVTVNSSIHGEFKERELERNEFYNANPSRRYYLEIPENGLDALKNDEIIIVVEGVKYKYVYRQK